MTNEEIESIALFIFKDVFTKYPPQEKKDLETIVNVFVCCLFYFMYSFISKDDYRLFARDIYDMLIENIDELPRKTTKQEKKNER